MTRYEGMNEGMVWYESDRTYLHTRYVLGGHASEHATNILGMSTKKFKEFNKHNIGMV